MKKKVKPAPAPKAKAARKPAEQPRSAGKQEPFPVGYNCVKCERFNVYPLYVAAHSTETLQHVCRCGARYAINRGIATQVKS